MASHPAASPPAPGWARLGPYLTLAALVALVYGQVGSYEFVSYDDLTNVAANPHVRGGLTWEGLRWAFDLEASPVTGIWHPVTWLSLMLDATLFGDRAGAFHLVNAALHLVCVLLLFGWLAGVTGARWKSLFVAAVWAVHPLQVESVAWISERKNLLSTLFGLLSLMAYGWYARGGDRSRWWYAASLGALALSLMSKPMLVTLPFVMLLLDRWPLDRLSRATARARVVEKVPFLLLSAASCVLAVLGQRAAGSITSREAVELPARIFNAVASYGLYLYKTALPVRLAVFYPHPKGNLSFLVVLGSALLVTAVTWLAVSRRRECPALLVGWLWFLGTLVPVLGLLQVGSQQIADRYVYVPQIGLLIAIAWFVPSVLRNRKLLAGVAAVLVAALAVTARAQASHWRSSVALFEHAVAVTRENHVAHQNLGVLLVAGGEVEAGLRHLREAARIRPRFVTAHLALAHALLGEGRTEEAHEAMARARAIDPGAGWSHDGTGRVLTPTGPAPPRVSSTAWLQLATDRADAGNVQGAATALLWAERADPDRPEVQHRLAVLLAGQGELDRAVEHLQKALALDPDDLFAHNRLAVLLQMQGRIEDSLPHLEAAVRLEPSSPTAHFNLGLTLLSLGRSREAMRSLEEAVRLDPEDATAREQLERARKMLRP